RLPPEREDRASAAQPLELVLAARLQDQARAVEEVTRRAGEEDLARPGERGHPRCGVDADATGLAADDLDLAGMETDADADPELRDRGIHERPGTDRSRGAVEEGQKAVAGGRHLPPAEAVDRGADPHVVLLQHPRPRVVAELLERRGGTDDVAEDHRGEHALAELLRCQPER